MLHFNSKTHTQGHLSKTLQSVYFTSLLLLLLCLALIVEHDAEKLGAQNKRILRFILGHYSIVSIKPALFLQKSTLLRCVTSAFRISSYCYMGLFFTHFPIAAYMK